MSRNPLMRGRSIWWWLLLGSGATMLLCVLLAVGAIAFWHYWETHNIITAIEPLPVGSSTHGITVDGRQRTYIVYRPAGLTGSTPLVVMLHGGFGSATQAQRGYGWDAEADSGHFLVAYPNGVTRSWNTGGGCCGKAAADNVDDVGFISAMVRQISLEADVDQSRVYATGISNGGIMAYTLACQTSLFAAIGPDSATELGQCPTPHPVSVIHIHGTADTRIRYNGGEGDGTAHIDGPAVPAVNSNWRTIDDCSAPGVTTSGVVTTSIANCPDGRTVELVTIQGAGHQWPGVKTNGLVRKLVGTDASSTALDATGTIWQFFSQHHK